MRRKEKEVTNIDEIEAIIMKGKVCRIGFSVDDMPYIVPMYYGYKDGCLFFHTALSGKKIDMLLKNSQVCFEIDVHSQIVNTGVPCDWKNEYGSVIGFGTACLIEGFAEKYNALDVLVRHYAPGTTYSFSKRNVERTAVIMVKISEMSGKISEK